ncbi:MAG: hypothetical protein HYY61_05300 [Deltaproteobacteria bacterium]|nr:hypothetical protein [Deltaproteobacteria bacterium]
MKKLFLILVVGIFLANPAFASFYTQCGKLKRGHKVELHIDRYDSNGEPADWDLRVRGKKPFILDPATIQEDEQNITVTLQTSDSTWKDYKFSDPEGDCAEYDSSVYKGLLEIYQRTVDESKLVKTLKCNCVED